MRAGTGSGKSRWKNPYQKMSAIETQDFQRRIQTLLRLKFPYESSFALLQLGHWLFCFAKVLSRGDISHLSRYGL